MDLLDRPDDFDAKKVEEGVRLILEGIGEDPDRGGLRETPARVARMYEEIFAGVGKDASELVTVVEGADHDEMIMVRDIPLYSSCEHHLLPWVGKAHVAYIPNKAQQITGLSYHYNTVTVDMTDYHAFSEINSDTTAAIIETGFLNLDRELLTKRPEMAAQGVASGILCFLRNEDIPDVPDVPTAQP